MLFSSFAASLFIGATRAGLWFECVDLPSGTNCTSINGESSIKILIIECLRMSDCVEMS